MVPVLLQSVPANIKARMWFQHDGTPAHFSADVQSALIQHIQVNGLDEGGPINWPARSLGLSFLDFFPWGHMKSVVYLRPVDSVEALVARIPVVAGDIWEMSGAFANVRQSLRRRCEACIFAERRSPDIQRRKPIKYQAGMREVVIRELAHADDMVLPGKVRGELIKLYYQMG
ncbi:uncharacterized protein TNCV_1707921 [Trichonephila clavipes]|nr:uncharacterized protein TNCV_1707921 [Trichonephila clavipes]